MLRREGDIINLSISTEDGLNDIPLIKEIKKDTAEIPFKLMAFDELGDPKKINDNFLREVARVLYGGDKNAKEVRIGDYLYYDAQLLIDFIHNREDILDECYNKFEHIPYK